MNEIRAKSFDHRAYAYCTQSSMAIQKLHFISRNQSCRYKHNLEEHSGGWNHAVSVRWEDALARNLIHVRCGTRRIPGRIRTLVRGDNDLSLDLFNSRARYNGGYQGIDCREKVKGSLILWRSNCWVMFLCLYRSFNGWRDDFGLNLSEPGCIIVCWYRACCNYLNNNTWGKERGCNILKIKRKKLSVCVMRVQCE